jgi:hypothetical protein
VTLACRRRIAVRLPLHGVVIGLSWLSAACHDDIEGSYLINCPGAFDIVVRPASGLLSIGADITFTAEFGEPARCSPPAPESVEHWRWTVADTTVASVDSLTGNLQAKAVGVTRLHVHHVLSPDIRDSADIDVRP